jgi:hypothetical protein
MVTLLRLQQNILCKVKIVLQTGYGSTLINPVFELFTGNDPDP